MVDWWIKSAVLAAHVKQAGAGFRQKDVRFTLELMASWRWAADERRAMPPLHNTQISRQLKELAHAGWLKVLGRTATPHYRLSRAGLVGVLEDLRAAALESELETYAFLAYVFRTYGGRLLQLIEREGIALPLPQRLEVEKILDSKALLRDRKKIIQERLQYWLRRVDENKKTVELVRTRLQEAIPFPEIMAEVERRYPYELNYHKPITMLLAEVPDDLKVWEMTEGQLLRAHQIWAISARALELELSLLDKEGANSNPGMG